MFLFNICYHFIKFEIIFSWLVVNRLYVAVFRIIFYIVRGVLKLQAALLFEEKHPKNTPVLNMDTYMHTGKVRSLVDIKNILK